jgi:hypothetical protein
VVLAYPRARRVDDAGNVIEEQQDKVAGAGRRIPP